MEKAIDLMAAGTTELDLSGEFMDIGVRNWRSVIAATHPLLPIACQLLLFTVAAVAPS